MPIQLKELKLENKYLQEKLDCKGSIVDKETITGAIEKLSKAQIQTSEKGSNAKLVHAQIQKNNHIVTSLQASTEDGSKKQSQESLEAPKVEVRGNISQATRVSYRHPNHRSCYDQQGQEENYRCYSYKEQIPNQQLQTIDQQTIPLKVNLGWTTSQMTQHFHTMFKRTYCLILFKCRNYQHTMSQEIITNKGQHLP